MKATMLRCYGAEFLGTYAYVFFGCGARIFIGYGTDLPGRLVIYFTFGFTLFAMTFALSHISAAPFNPAVTFGFAVARRFPWRYILPYWIAQVLGALAASGTHFLLFRQQAVASTFGATIPTVGPIQAMAIEGIMTFFLMLVSMSSITEKRVNRANIGFAIGMVITFCGLFSAPLTGGSLNPARSLAPALFAGGKALAIVWVYWIGPLIGATLGAIVYEVLCGRDGKSSEENAIDVPEGLFDTITRKHEHKSELQTFLQQKREKKS